MSGEPKTLTLTLEEAGERLAQHALVLLYDGDNHASVAWAVRPQTDPEPWMRESLGKTWPEAVSAALGVRVVARDEAAELRAAVREYLEAGDTAHAATTMRSVTDDEFDDLLKRKDAAFAALRRLAGGEEQE